VTEQPIDNARQPRVTEDKPKRTPRYTFVREQAKREVEKAERALELAKERGSKTGIDDAERKLKEKRDELKKLDVDDPDKLSRRAKNLRDKYYDDLGPYIVGLAREVPELRAAIQEAIANGWTSEKFLSDKRVIDWLATKGPAAGAAIAIEFDPTKKATWEEKLRNARNAVKDLATKTYNLNLTDETLDRLARRYIYEGWDADPRALQVWMSGRVERGGERTETITGGTITSNENDLRQLARNYGLSYTDDWFRSQANNLLNPDSGVTRENLVNNMIREAESLYPVFAGRLNESFSVRDAANSYIAQMSRWLEIDADEIDLNDDLLNKAFTTQTDEKGQPKIMSLWEFQKAAREDERWQKTDNAITAYTDIGERMLKMFGFRG
jgi:hypothetical protein